MQRLTKEYERRRDPALAAPMPAYMRDLFPFLGIKAPPRRALNRRVLDGLARPDEADLTEVALACWALPEREYQYFAVDWLRQPRRTAHPDVPADGPIPHHHQVVVGHRRRARRRRRRGDGRADPELVSTMDEWVVGSDPDVGSPSASPKTAALPTLWLTRTAILHQLRYRAQTDSDRLFRYCAVNAGHRDFFIRKAIGWALRQYAKTDPDAVRDFVASQPALSNLSVREAVKNL